MNIVNSIWGQLLWQFKKLAQKLPSSPSAGGFVTYYSKKILFLLIVAFLFLLPWQTRYIFNQAEINGQPWEYGTKSLYGTEILAWLIILFFILSNVGKIKEFFFRNKILYCYIVTLLHGCFVLGLFVVAYVGSSPSVSFYYIYRLLLGLAVCWCIVKSSSLGAREVFHLRANPSTPSYSSQGGIWLMAFWAGGVVQGILAVIQFFSQRVTPNKWLGIAEQVGGRLGTAVIGTDIGRWLRAYGAFGWPNSLGIYLAIVWVVGLVLYFKIIQDVRNNGTHEIMKINRCSAIVTAGQLCILSGLIVSFSRGAWIAAGVGVVVLVVLRMTEPLPGPLLSKERGSDVLSSLERRGWGKLQGLFSQLLYSSFVVIFFLITLWPLFTTRVTATGRLEQKSVNERVGQWKQAFQIIKKHPLTGVGPGALTAHLHLERPEEPVWNIQPTHNIYLLILVENGLVVAGLLVVVYSISLIKLWQHNRLYLSVIAVVVVGGLFDHWLVSLYSGMMVWFVVWGVGGASMSPVANDSYVDNR